MPEENTNLSADKNINLADAPNAAVTVNELADTNLPSNDGDHESGMSEPVPPLAASPENQLISETSGQTETIADPIATVPAPPAAINPEMPTPNSADSSQPTNEPAIIEETAPTPSDPVNGENGQPTTVAASETATPSPAPAAPPLTSPVNTLAEPPRTEQAAVLPAEISATEKRQIFQDQLKTLSRAGVSKKQMLHQEKLDKIIAYLKEHGYVTNNEVEKICKVADSTARKYLNELEKSGLLLQQGDRGRRVNYRLKQAINKTL